MAIRSFKDEEAEVFFIKGVLPRKDGPALVKSLKESSICCTMLKNLRIYLARQVIFWKAYLGI